MITGLTSAPSPTAAQTSATPTSPFVVTTAGTARRDERGQRERAKEEDGRLDAHLAEREIHVQADLWTMEHNPCLKQHVGEAKRR